MYYCKHVLIVLGSSLVLSQSVFANEVDRVRLDPSNKAEHQLKFEVGSTGGQVWNSVLDKSTRIGAQLTAKCSTEGRGNKAYSGQFEASGFEMVGDLSPANKYIPNSDYVEADFKYVGGGEFDPVQLCRSDLGNAMAGNIFLDAKDYVSKKRILRLKKVVPVNYRLTCSGIRGGKTDIERSHIKLDAVVDCQAYKVPQAEFIPLIKSVEFAAQKPVYTEKCPVTVKMNGKISANRAGTVKYQYISHDGKKSPTLTMKFTEPGQKSTREWNEVVSKPGLDRLSSGGAKSKNAPDVKGSYTLKIVEPKNGGQVSADYEVKCVKSVGIVVPLQPKAGDTRKQTD